MHEQTRSPTINVRKGRKNRIDRRTKKRCNKEKDSRHPSARLIGRTTRAIPGANELRFDGMSRSSVVKGFPLSWSGHGRYDRQGISSSVLMFIDAFRIDPYPNEMGVTDVLKQLSSANQQFHSMCCYSPIRHCNHK